MDLEFKMPKQLDFLSRLMGGGKHSAIGVDVGSNSVKVVQLKKEKNRIVLVNYASVKVDRELTSSGSANHLVNEIAGEVVKNVFEKLGIKEKDINLAVPSFASLITVVNLDVTSEKEAQEIIEREAPKFIPMPIEEVVYDWQIIDGEDELPESKDEDQPLMGGGEKRIKVASKKKKAVLVAVMKEISQQYEEILGANGYRINSLEVDSFSLTRALIGEEKKSYVILDIGGRVCSIILIYQGNLVMNKSVNVAGYKLTQAMASSMDIDIERAEKMKVQQGLENNLKQIKDQVFDPLLETIVQEVKSSIETFTDNHKSAKIEGVILSGGTSRMIGLVDYFKQNLGMEVFIGNPWSGIDYPKELEQELIKLGPSFATAIGLAMLGLGEE